MTLCVFDFCIVFNVLFSPFQQLEGTGATLDVVSKDRRLEGIFSQKHT